MFFFLVFLVVKHFDLYFLISDAMQIMFMVIIIIIIIIIIIVAVRQGRTQA